MYGSLHRKIGSAPLSSRIFFGHEYTEQNLSFALTGEPGNEALNDRVRSARDAIEAGKTTTPTSLGLERETNPFLRCGSPEIMEAVRQEDPGNDLTPVSVFRVLRAMKDRF
jgi:hydroxyacylglutathione hydrolase